MLTTGTPALAALWKATETSSVGMDPVTMAAALASTACCMQLAMLAGFALPSQTCTFTRAAPSAAWSEAPTAWNTGTW